MKHKSSFTLGLEKVLNNPNASFLNNPATFNEIGKQSGMSVTQMLKHIGKKRTQTSQPSEKEKSKERLEELKTHSGN